MNYAGFDMYAHNRATSRYGRSIDTRSFVPSVVALDCPFCGSANLSGATVTFEPGARTDLEDRLSRRARHALLPGRASR